MARRSLVGEVLALASALALAACYTSSGSETEPPSDVVTPSQPLGGGKGVKPAESSDDGPHGVVVLGFAGDVHFEYHLRGFLTQPLATFGSMRPALAEPDLMMVNLETAITERGTPEPKEFQFRVEPSALALLDAAGVDLVSLANNHAIDYGPVGLQDTLRALRDGPLPAVGIGRDIDAAFRPYRASVRGTRIAVFAVDTLRERARAWAARQGKAGIAVALTPRLRLLEAVRRASARDDVVVVYLHWGREGHHCPTNLQLRHAHALADAGADIVVGSHAHVVQGAGWMGDTYVDYGLGNFLWYHPGYRETGILRLEVRDGDVVGDTWLPAENLVDGPELVPAGRRGRATEDWRRLRSCTGLASTPVT